MSKDRSGTTTDAGEWPAIGYERHRWETDSSLPLSRTQRRRHQGPYDAAVVAHLAEQPLRLSGEVIAEADDASVAIARFDAYVAARLDGPAATGELAPMASILLRTESASSSQIENLTVGARQVALAELGERASRNANIVASNGAAMRAALAMADRIDEESILEMQRTLLVGSDPDNAGRWREQQVWVGGSGAGPHSAHFVPPHHSRVPDDVRDLVAFIDREDLPVLAHSALAHAQFETIHPFTDGNGRTGRALLHAMLRSKGLTERVTVPVSAGLLSDTEAYFDSLDDYRRGDPAPIVRQLCRASFAAIENGQSLVDDLSAIRYDWSERITARRDAAVWRLVDLLVRHPVVNNALVGRELGVSDVAAQGAIDQLVSIGVLVAEGQRRRNRLWRSPEVLEALDAFAVRAGRRRTA
ncbi:MAG: Fic family protein [Nocardioidaceae bacterium]